MSTEPEQPPADDTTPTGDTDPNLPTEPGPGEVEVPPEEPETPPPPPGPPSPIVFEPFTYYSVTSVCTTADKGDGTPCPNLNTTTTESMVYSNAGTVRMFCGLCNKIRPILAATKLDPQPEVS